MAKFKQMILAGCFMAAGHTASADVLEATVFRALQDNPDMAVAIQQYYASREDVDIATGNFLPSIDVIADTGKEDITRDPNSGAEIETDLDRTSARLQLSLPLFKGFANQSEHQRASKDMEASYYQSLAEAESITLQISQAYIGVISAKEIVVLSLENLEHHEKTYELVHARQQQGVADKADLSQIRGRMARAKANLANARNNLRDAETSYQQIVGEMPVQLVRPQSDSSYIPDSNQRLLDLAMANNQSLLASRLSVEASEANSKGQNSHYYPQFDLVADTSWKEDVAGFEGNEEEWRVMLEMNWNLYSGGSKSSAHQKAVYLEQAARMRSNKVVREVKANVDSSWSAYKSLEQELIYLQEYVTESKETEKLYAAQFKAGRRTLLDLLDSQNELFQARKAYVSADYQYLYAQYRVIASMSYILDALNVNVMEGLHNEDA
ncbi:Outer membrane efflux protein BepC [Sinobacterium norvegicum]|uniref:Outer membrane efflux protein BepC n=1 Tax=Sinobacterium norvegicum TaxID=1641715 RepID=A0ABM9AAW9_9GAMM|nr:TolC family outer membrane protein [Sinobacterium norvegicum]CAH0990024.1 Outer membrane efflux protein BepC [Sinobacterium norvegicum]